MSLEQLILKRKELNRDIYCATSGMMAYQKRKELERVNKLIMEKKKNAS